MENDETNPKNTVLQPVRLSELLKGSNTEHTSNIQQTLVPEDSKIKGKKSLQPVRMGELLKENKLFGKQKKNNKLVKGGQKAFKNVISEQLSPEYNDFSIKPKKTDVNIRRNLFKQSPKITFQVKKKSPSANIHKKVLPNITRKLKQLPSKQNNNETSNKTETSSKCNGIKKSIKHHYIHEETTILQNIEDLLEEENELSNIFLQKRHEIRCKINKLIDDLKAGHTKKEPLLDEKINRSPLLNLEEEENRQFPTVVANSLILNTSQNSSETIQFEELEKEFASDKENEPKQDLVMFCIKNNTPTKSVLKKTDPNNPKLQTEGKSVTFTSPLMDKSQRAITMYNSFRNDCTLLCTPKFSNTESPSSSKCLKNQLSRAIHKQCLMLLETPSK